MSHSLPANDNVRHDFAIRNLSVLSYSQGFTHWHYKGGSVEAVTNPAFFNKADQLRPGDVLWISAHDGFVSHYILQGGPGLVAGPDMRSLLIERARAGQLGQRGEVA
jgi:hypothetical protein